jgi:hypothetical protein
MKSTLLAIYATLSIGVSQDFPPVKFDPRRYDTVVEKNPFMYDIVVKATVNPRKDPWADNLVIKAVSRINGLYVVHVEDTKLVEDPDPEKRKQAHSRLVEGQLGDLRLQSVKPHRDPAQVEVVLITGEGESAKTATVKYDVKQLFVKAPVTAIKRAANKRSALKPSTRPAVPLKRRVILPPTVEVSSHKKKE